MMKTASATSSRTIGKARSKNKELKEQLPSFAYEVISPALAKQYLSKKLKNRQISRLRVMEYVEEMRNGRWRITHQGIAFDNKGYLIDGQHRLLAIIETGIEVVMGVTRGLHPDAMLSADQGRSRSAADLLTMDGVANASKRISIGNRIQSGINRRKSFVTLAETRKRIYEQHKDAVEFVMEHTKGSRRGVGSAAICAVVGRAWYTQDREKLKVFLHILNYNIAPDGYEVDRDWFKAITGLRDYLMRFIEDARISGQSNDMIEEFAKTQRLLWAFLHDLPGCGKGLRVLRDINVFPIPSDEHYPNPQGYKVKGTKI